MLAQESSNIQDKNRTLVAYFLWVVHIYIFKIPVQKPNFSGSWSVTGGLANQQFLKYW